MTSQLKNVFVYGYVAGCKSAKLLADTLEVKRVLHTGSTLKGSPALTIINWGASPKTFLDQLYGAKIFNPPERIALCANKIRFFNHIASKAAGPRVPTWTRDMKEAKKWLVEGKCVLARTLVEAFDGDGLVEMNKVLDFVEAPLYTVYVPKKLEYRIMMWREEVVHAYRKVCETGKEPGSWKIRTGGNGFYYWDYKIDDVPPEVIVQSKLAMKAVGLDFGGVDVIFGEDKKAYVLEINTAPWLEELTAKKYSELFRKACA